LNNNFNSESLTDGNGLPTSVIGWLVLLVLITGFGYLIKLILLSTKK
jgi:hypothetical protein